MTFPLKRMRMENDNNMEGTDDDNGQSTSNKMKTNVETEIPLKKKRDKSLNFSYHPKRKIAIQFLYQGWHHDGLVIQPNTQNTVEGHIRKALEKTKLIEDWTKCDVSRCGRTDKGVSSYKQVMALIVRSSNPNGKYVFWSNDTPSDVKDNYSSKAEFSYLKMLNFNLPSSISVTAWAPVPQDFSARHACNMRVYKYDMPRANLNVERIQEACQLLVGKHDFRNFCQIDMNPARVNMSYEREIFDASIVAVSDTNPGQNDDYSRDGLLELTISGSGFLWHMIRYIVTVLFEIGRCNEQIELISELFDVEKNPARPQYTLSVGSPLCLFDCRYDSHNLEWTYDTHTMSKTVTNLQKTIADLNTKSRLMQNMLNDLVKLPDAQVTNLDEGLLEFIHDRRLNANYVPFLKRKMCESLSSKKKKLLSKSSVSGEKRDCVNQDTEEIDE